MRPFDLRLLRTVPAVRRDAAVLAVCGGGVALAVVASATFLAAALAAVAGGSFNGTALAGFVVAIGLRALFFARAGDAAPPKAATGEHPLWAPPGPPGGRPGA